MKNRIIPALLLAAPLIVGWSGAAAAFGVCTWGWILDNCESAKCETAKPCREVVIDYYIGRAKRTECVASDATKIASRCKKCNADNCSAK